MKVYRITFEVDGVKRKRTVRASSAREAVLQVLEEFPDALILGAGW